MDETEKADIDVI